MPLIPTGLAALAHGIQLAVAPVFLLTAVGTLLGVLAGRLGRIIDRARLLESRLPSLHDAALAHAYDELDTLSRRVRIVNGCMALATGCAVLIAVVVAAVFVGELAHIDLSVPIAATFVGGLLAYIAALLLFLREVHIASTSFKVTRVTRA
ncbi:MAG TPA: DUF2721 domain-containing protein [Burkholderiaceae bacterium]|nr:DUF2721 domain-containing protein [Burkholderiaceae bacterium]